MRKILICLIVIYLSGCAGITPKQTNHAVDEILQQLQIAIDDIGEKKLGPALPPLKEAEIKLSIKSGDKKSGEAAIVVSGNIEKESTESSVLTLVLTPKPKSTDKSNLTGAKTAPEIKGEKIAEYVIAAIDAIKNSKSSLQLKALTYEAGLEFKDKGTTGIDVELVGVKIKGGREKSSATFNTLILSFEKNDKKEASEKKGSPDLNKK